MFERDDMTTLRVTVTGDPRHHLMEETFEHPVYYSDHALLPSPVILSSGDGRVQAAIISSASAARVHYTITAPEACLVMWQSDNMGSYGFHSIALRIIVSKYEKYYKTLQTGLRSAVYGAARCDSERLVYIHK